MCLDAFRLELQADWQLELKQTIERKRASVSSSSSSSSSSRNSISTSLPLSRPPRTQTQTQTHTTAPHVPAVALPISITSQPTKSEPADVSSASLQPAPADELPTSVKSELQPTTLRRSTRERTPSRKARYSTPVHTPSIVASVSPIALNASIRHVLQPDQDQDQGEEEGEAEAEALTRFLHRDLETPREHLSRFGLNDPDHEKTEVDPICSAAHPHGPAASDKSERKETGKAVKSGPPRTPAQSKTERLRRKLNWPVEAGGRLSLDLKYCYQLD